jgi:hypothetical protein
MKRNKQVKGVKYAFTEENELYYFLKSAGLYRNILGICTKKAVSK